MAGRLQSRATIDRDEIRAWAVQNGGTPASVRYTDDGVGPGVLRIDFHCCADQDQLEHISWETWFQKFDDAGLALLYQTALSGRGGSTFFRLVKR